MFELYRCIRAFESDSLEELLIMIKYMLYMFTVLSPQGIKGSQCHFMLWREAKETVLLKLRNWAQLDNPDISHHHFKTKLILL